MLHNPLGEKFNTEGFKENKIQEEKNGAKELDGNKANLYHTHCNS